MATVKTRKGRKCVSMMHAHLVFLTKNRRGAFTKKMYPDLKDIFASVCNDFGCELVEMYPDNAHVHLHVTFPTKVAVSSLVNSLKGVSSRMIRKKHPNIEKKLVENSLWSPSYFAGSCEGPSLDVVQEFIDSQK